MCKLLGWVVTLALAAVAVVSLDPASVGLSTTAPVAQIIALRAVLAAGFAVLGVLVLLPVLLAALVGRRWPRGTVLAVVLLAVGAGHGWVVLDRGVGEDGLPPAREGAVTVFTLNTYGGGADFARVAGAAGEVGADVLALPETNAGTAERIAAELTDLTGTGFQVFVERIGEWDANSTALLVSEELGGYVAAPAPTTWHASVRAEPADGDGPTFLAVHPISPHQPDAMDQWRADLTAATEPCRSEPDVVVAGDFNATLDHAPMRDVGACVDASVAGAVGGVATWPAQLPRLLGAPIDHILLDGESYAVDAAAVLDIEGSDHRAVVAQLVPADG